jgi:hypothetical protein
MEKAVIPILPPEDDELFNDIERLSNVRKEMLRTPHKEARLLAEITVLSEMVRILSARVKELEDKYNDKFGEKKKNCDNLAPNVATNVHHNEQKPDHLVNILPNLSIQSEDLSIKSEEAMREVQRLGQEIEQEPVAYINIEERKLEWAYKYMSWDTPTVVNLPKIPLYTTPPQRTWVGLTDEEIVGCATGLIVGGMEFAKAVEAKLKDKNT